MTENGAQIAWQSCVIDEIVQQTPSIKSFFLRLSKPFAHIAGQHVDVRLTAPGGYSAMRSYSIASSAISFPTVELAIERLPDGEVSPFFHDVAAIGDEIELRGPLGGHFLWPEPAIDPVLLIGAGSGLVPLMAMIRQRRALAQVVPTALLLSARTAEDVLFSKELHSIECSDPAFALALAITRDSGQVSTSGMVATDRASTSPPRAITRLLWARLFSGRWVAVSAQDVPPEARSLEEVTAVWRNSTKHVQTESIVTAAEAAVAIEMAAAIAGGRDALRAHPVLSLMQCTISPSSPPCAATSSRRRACMASRVARS